MAPSTSTPAISIRAVTKTFGPKVAVDDLDLIVPSGSVCAFLGPNGAGKTTTIRMVMSIVFPDRGEISVLGRASALESKDLIGYLPEERGLYRKMRVASFIEYMGRLKGVPDPELRAAVPAWLARVGLADVARKRCEELSKGMQQKIQFIAAVIHEPDLIILDEPFSGLDPVNARLLRELIAEQSRAGRTIIFSTHVMEHAEQLCDHVFMIDRGRKVLDASMRDIRSRFVPHVLIVEPLADIDARGEDGGIAALERLGRMEGLATHAPEAPIERVGGAWELRYREGTDMRGAMAGVFDAIPVRRVEIKRPSLDDIFINLVLRDGGAADGVTEADLRASLSNAPIAAPDAGEPARGGAAR